MDRNRVGTPNDDPATAQELRALQTAASDLAASLDGILSEAFAIESSVVATPGGPEAAISVYPPDGPPIAAGIALADLEDCTDEIRRELVHDLVATAVDHARTSVGDRFIPAGQ